MGIRAPKLSNILKGVTKEDVTFKEPPKVHRKTRGGWGTHKQEQRNERISIPRILRMQAFCTPPHEEGKAHKHSLCTLYFPHGSQGPR